MEIAIYTLTAKEVKEQEQVISKCRSLIQKELDMGDLMNLENVQSYTKDLKNAHDLIVNGIIYENEFMVNQLRNNPNAKIVTA